MNSSRERFTRPSSSPSAEGDEARPKKHKAARSRLRSVKCRHHTEAAGTVCMWDTSLRRDLNGSVDGDVTQMELDGVEAGHKIVKSAQGKGITAISKSERNRCEAVFDVHVEYQV